MCGIAFIGDTKPLEPGHEQAPAWEACLASLARRGPDGSGTWVSPDRSVILGHTRLAIVDLSTAGRQPMKTSDSQICITYNGELYNAPALRNELKAEGARFVSACDTEVLLHAWKRWGRGMLDRFRGMFSFVLWDESARQLFAAIDHVGMKPLVWKEQGAQLLIASDCDSLRELTGHVEQLSDVAVRLVLTLSCCPPPMTMWTGIQKLMPGHCLEWSPGREAIVTRYYSPPDMIDDVSRMKPDAFGALLEQIVEDHLVSDVSVGAFLSGGIDSAAIVTAAHRSGAMPTCFTLAMESEANELADAQRVADSLGLLHVSQEAGSGIGESLHEFAAAFDEPQGYSALLTMVQIANLASQDVKSVIAGDGGDESFGGYLWQREQGRDAWQSYQVRDDLIGMQATVDAHVARPETGDADRAIARRVYGSHSFVHGYLSRVFPGFHPAEAETMTSAWNTPYSHEDAAGWLAGEDRPALSHVRRVQRLDLLGFCPASILPKVDRAAMHYGLEVRTPLLDRRMIQLGLAMPVQECELLGDGSQSRPLLREYVARHLGESFAKRPKQGFSVRVANELNYWREFASRVQSMKIVTHGMLNANWLQYVPYGDMTRLRIVCMLAAWAESRL